MYTLATLLDPRYKGRLFAPDKLEAIKQWAIHEARFEPSNTHHNRRQRRRRALARWTYSTPYWVRHAAPTSSASAASLVDPELSVLSVKRNRRLNGGQQTLPSTRCWLQKPSVISARRQRLWLVSTCLALLGGSTQTNGYFPSLGKKLNYNRGKKSRFRFLAQNRDFRFRIRESSIAITVCC